MKVIIPMAGMGKRLRPHTLTTPKPLFPIAGKPIVQRLVEDIAAVYDGQLEEVAYITGEFGEEINAQLIEVAEKLGAKASIYKQDEALGTAHAIWCARESMSGEVIIAFADTLFRADFNLDKSKDAIIWVKQIEDPSAFGVVLLNEDNNITNFVEKPKEPISNLAIIGIYYIKNASVLMEEINFLLSNKIVTHGEYQLTDALERMRIKGLNLGVGEVSEWMDCGNKDNVLDTNAKILLFSPDHHLVSSSANIINSQIIHPCFIGDGAIIENSVVGPFTAVGAGVKITNSIIKNSILHQKSSLENVSIDRSIIGRESTVKKDSQVLNIGDFSHG